MFLGTAIGFWGGQYIGFLADTYTDIENGVGVDYFCLNDQKVDTSNAPIGLPNTYSCIYFSTLLSPLNMATVLRKDGFCTASIPQALVFVCDP